MTREEEIRNEVDKTFPISNPDRGRTYEQALMATGFEAGIKWADNNPKSPWISVEDDLPCNHEDLLMSSKDYTKEVLACLIWMDHYEHKKFRYVVCMSDRDLTDQFGIGMKVFAIRSLTGCLCQRLLINYKTKLIKIAL